MKKFFAIAILATAFVACNNSSEKKGGEGDTTKPADTTVTTPAPADTTTPAPADTTKAADTTKPKM